MEKLIFCDLTKTVRVILSYKAIQQIIPIDEFVKAKDELASLSM